jgi:hypothetical protein
MATTSFLSEEVVAVVGAVEVVVFKAAAAVG